MSLFMSLLNIANPTIRVLAWQEVVEGAVMQMHEPAASVRARLMV